MSASLTTSRSSLSKVPVGTRVVRSGRHGAAASSVLMCSSVTRPPFTETRRMSISLCCATSSSVTGVFWALPPLLGTLGMCRKRIMTDGGALLARRRSRIAFPEVRPATVLSLANSSLSTK